MDVLASCLVVAAPSGRATVRVRATIPEGFALSQTYVADLPCAFPGLGEGSGQIVATISGQISASCHI